MVGVMIGWMARRGRDIEDLARRIEALDESERANLIARLMKAEGRRVEWSMIEGARQRFKGEGERGLGAAIDAAVRGVRHRVRV